VLPARVVVITGAVDVTVDRPDIDGLFDAVVETEEAELVDVVDDEDDGCAFVCI
jgi:hypothetical protein